MRLISIIIVSVALTGCAAHQPAVSADQQLQQAAYAPSGAAALAFDPPVLAGTTRMDLSRDGRDVGAFVGYQDSTTIISDLHLDDLQTGNPSSDRYQREAASDTITSNTR
jgi:hypothetical protein